MQVRDIMTTNVVRASPDSTVGEIAEMLVANEVSAVPVVDDKGKLLGIVSEGDLIRRLGNELPERASWWLELLASPDKRAASYLRVHGRTAREVMTKDVKTIGETATVAEAARLMDTHRVKRVPVVRDGLLSGVVSRADLVRVLTLAGPAATVEADDRALRQKVLAELAKAGQAHHPYVNVIVAEGKVHLWGFVDSRTVADAMILAAKNTPGVSNVESKLTVRSIPASI